MISDDLTLVGKLLREGKIVAFPTETVWGIGANARNWEACLRIYSIKGRPADNPLILHVESLESISEIAHTTSSTLEKLKPWIPGPLTMIFKKKDNQLFSCGLDTIAVRVPKLELTRQMIKEAKNPIAAPSANLSGKPSLTRFNDVVEIFENRVDLILKGPSATHGLESTVIDFSGLDPVYVRPGMVSFEEVKVAFPNLKNWKEGHPIASPGMKYRHYSPEGTVVIMEHLHGIPAESKVGQIGFHLKTKTEFDLQISNNEEYAKELYAFFVECDKRGLKKVYCQIPKEGLLNQAIIHRLEKAATR